MLTLLRLMCSRFSHGGHAVGAGLVRVLATTAVAPCAWGPRSPRIAHGPCSPHRSFPPRGPACLACTRRVREMPPPRRSRGVGGRARNRRSAESTPVVATPRLPAHRHPFFSLLSGSLDHVEHPLDRAPGFFRNGRLNHHLVLQCFERAQDLG